MDLYEFLCRQRLHSVVVNSNSFPFGGSGSSLKDETKAWNPTVEYSDTTSSATSISNILFEDESTIDIDHGEHPETLKYVSDPPCSVFERKCPRRRPGPEQDDSSQIKNLCLAPKLGTIAPAELSSQASDAFCIPDGVAHSYNLCITEEDAEWEVRVGQEGYATRWKKGSVLRYIICTETFPSPQWAELVAREFAKAVSMWQNIGARFEEVGRDKTATFAIQYCPKPDNCRPDVYARAFFPKTSRGELFVYQLALEHSNVEFLANILAHELGHILGLSHEFAIHTSFLWGKKNDQSVMNYFSDLGQLQVRQQDREDLATYYECEEGKYKRLFITDIEPRLYRFPRSNEYSVGSYRSTLKRLYLNYRVKRSRSRRNSSLIQQTDE